MTIYRGAFHLHSKYSYDSQITLRDLADLLKSNGYAFALMSEHAYHRAEKRFLTEAEFQSLIDECKALSTPNFLMIPGLEFACHDNKVHIIGTPFRRAFSLEGLHSAPKILRAIHDEQGRAILVHPFFAQAYTLLKKEELLELDGFEVWNYDYQKSKGPSLLEYLKIHEIFRRFPRLRPFAGQDLHKKEGWGEVDIEMEAGALNIDKIFQRLDERRYRLKAFGRSFDSKGNVENLFSHLLKRQAAKFGALLNR